MNKFKTVFVTGGAGYVGSVLVPKLLNQGYHVRVLDLFLYGEDIFNAVKDDPKLETIKGDMRDRALLERVIPGSDAVIHLACISNDPSFELDPELGKSINYDAFIDLANVSRESGVKRFIYASSSSVYGIKDEEHVTEDLPLEPLTDYSKYKMMCEEYLNENKGDMVALTLRPATVCGYSPRLRLDLTVNILSNHAYNNRVIKVFGGEQQRPNLHIEDMTDLYLKTLVWVDEDINGKIYNAGYQNYKVKEIAKMVQDIIGDDVDIVTTPTDDNRSYRVNSDKIKNELGFEPSHTIEDAIQDLFQAFKDNKIPDSMEDKRYFNIKMMQAINMK